MYLCSRPRSEAVDERELAGKNRSIVNFTTFSVNTSILWCLLL